MRIKKYIILKIFIFLLIFPFNLVFSRWQARFSDSNNGLNNKLFHQQFFIECHNQRRQRQAQQFLVPSSNNNFYSGQNSYPSVNISAPINNKSNCNNGELKKIIPPSYSEIKDNLPKDIKNILNNSSNDQLYNAEFSQEQKSVSQKINNIASHAAQLLRNSDKFSDAVDLLSVISFATKLNKQNRPELAQELLENYQESHKLIDANWTENISRKELNSNLVVTAKSISHASLLTPNLPTSLIASAGLTSAAMQLARQEDIDLSLSQDIYNIVNNLIN